MVMGSPACDLDSMVSALARGYYNHVVSVVVLKRMNCMFCCLQPLGILCVRYGFVS